MVKVRLWASLAAFADGQTELEVEADTLRGLLDALGRDYPGMRPQLARGVSVAIDGRIYNDTWSTPIHPESEVVLLQRLIGG